MMTASNVTTSARRPVEEFHQHHRTKASAVGDRREALPEASRCVGHRRRIRQRRRVWKVCRGVRYRAVAVGHRKSHRRPKRAVWCGCAARRSYNRTPAPRRIFQAVASWSHQGVHVAPATTRRTRKTRARVGMWIGRATAAATVWERVSNVPRDHRPDRTGVSAPVARRGPQVPSMDSAPPTAREVHRATTIRCTPPRVLRRALPNLRYLLPTDTSIIISSSSSSSSWPGPTTRLPPTAQQHRRGNTIVKWRASA